MAVVAGAEAIYARLLARKEKAWLEWTTQVADTAPPEMMGDDRPGTNAAEMTRSLALPTQVYPIFENALRAAAGESIDDHQVKVSELWSRFSEVAAKNPYAWSPDARTAEEIRSVTPDNRMIGFPYPKLMNANIQTDQAAAVIVCSVEAAEPRGCPKIGGSSSIPAPTPTTTGGCRSGPTSTPPPPSPPVAERRAGLGRRRHRCRDSHLDHVLVLPVGRADRRQALGLSLDRQLTVTGGLTFAGGPGNSYVTHSIASMLDVLRSDPGSLGLVTALGWFITKHSVGIYSSEPPASGFRSAHPQDEVDASPRRELASDVDAEVTIESHTVIYDRDGSPSLGIVACLLDDGRRAWGNVRDEPTLAAMIAEDPIGRTAHVSADGTLAIT